MLLRKYTEEVNNMEIDVIKKAIGKEINVILNSM